MWHLTDQAIEAFTKGDRVKAKVLDVDVDKERISLGIKQLSGDPIESAVSSSGESAGGGGGGLKRGATVTCTVTEITTGGIEVEFGTPAVKSFIRRSDLSRDRADQRPERFAVGDKVDAKIITVDRATRRVSLSIKALEIAEEAEAVAQYGSADAGASLGDILGAALASSAEEYKPIAKRQKTVSYQNNIMMDDKTLEYLYNCISKTLNGRSTEFDLPQFWDNWAKLESYALSEASEHEKITYAGFLIRVAELKLQKNGGIGALIDVLSAADLARECGDNDLVVRAAKLIPREFQPH